MNRNSQPIDHLIERLKVLPTLPVEPCSGFGNRIKISSQDGFFTSECGRGENKSPAVSDLLGKEW